MVRYFFLLPTGRTEEAVTEMERALEGDPLNTIFRVVLAVGLMACGRYEDASAACRRLLELNENYWYGCAVLAWSYAARGMFSEALPIAEKAYSLAPWNAIGIAVLAAALEGTGDAIRAQAVLQPLLNAPETYAAPRGPLIFHVLRGEIDEAAAWAEKSIAQRDPYGTILHPWLLRSSAHWPALAKRINLPERVS